MTWCDWITRHQSPGQHVPPNQGLDTMVGVNAGHETRIGGTIVPLGVDKMGYKQGSDHTELNLIFGHGFICEVRARFNSMIGGRLPLYLALCVERVSRERRVHANTETLFCGMKRQVRGFRLRSTLFPYPLHPAKCQSASHCRSTVSCSIGTQCGSETLIKCGNYQERPLERRKGRVPRRVGAPSPPRPSLKPLNLSLEPVNEVRPTCNPMQLKPSVFREKMVRKQNRSWSQLRFRLNGTQKSQSEISSWKAHL